MTSPLRASPKCASIPCPTPSVCMRKQAGFRCRPGFGGTQQSASMIGEYNWAIWSLFDPSLAIDSTAQGLVSQAQKYAPNDLSYYANVRILTPVAHTNGTPWTDSTSPQEYITIVSAPEPSSLALLGSGLAAFIFRIKKKRANP